MPAPPPFLSFPFLVSFLVSSPRLFSSSPLLFSSPLLLANLTNNIPGRTHEGLNFAAFKVKCKKLEKDDRHGKERHSEKKKKIFILPPGKATGLLMRLISYFSVNVVSEVFFRILKFVVLGKKSFQLIFFLLCPKNC